MVGEIAVEVEPPDGDDKPHPEVIGTAETVLDEEIPGGGLAAERASIMPGVKPVCASNGLGMIESNAAATRPGLAVARKTSPGYVPCAR